MGSATGTQPSSRRALVGAALLLAACAPGPPTPASRPPTERLVGAYYFAGWWSKPVPSNYLRNHTTDWRPAYPEREPAAGWFDDTQAVVDEEIAQAADAGLDYFAFDEYAEVGADNPGAEANANNGLTFYLASPNRSRLRFALFYVNHATSDPTRWDGQVASWVKLMREPGYLAIAGRPVLFVYRPDLFRAEWGPLGGARAALDRLRAAAAAADLAPPLLGAAGVDRPGPAADAAAGDGYDFLTSYALPVDDRSILPQVPTDYPAMIDAQVGLWRELAAASPLPYAPSILSGWDARPVGEGTNYLTGRTPERFATLLAACRAALDGYARFRLPAADAATGLATIYAWNELGEGGYVVPTRAEGDAYLRQVAPRLHGP